MAEAKSGTVVAAGGAKAPRLRWDDSRLRTTYANVCNVSSTREEVVLLFGVNQSWHAGPEVTVQLQDRVILSPLAAKRLSLLLSSVVAEHEKRFGELEVTPSGPAPVKPKRKG